MEFRAALDPIIAILVAVGWFIVKALLNRSADVESWEEFERKPQPVPPPEPPPVIARKQQPLPPPLPVPPPVIAQEQEGPYRVMGQLAESRRAHERATHLEESVAAQLAAVGARVTKHKPSSARIRIHAMEDLVRTFRKPATLRQAVIASIILNPPKSLEP